MTEYQTEVTFDVEDVRVRADIVGNLNGKTVIAEVKNGRYARYTDNQKIAYPKLKDNTPIIPKGGKASLYFGEKVNNPFTDYVYRFFRY